MSGNDNIPTGDTAQAFLEQLEKSGFFQQVKGLEANLRKISEDIKALGETATQRLEETESLAAHVLAIESILMVLLKDNPINEDDLKAAIREKTASLMQNADGSSAVQNIAETISTGKKL